VDIISSPWAILDHNKPEERGPHAFVVEAVITNTGSTTATNPIVTLDYNDPTNNWILLPGEDPGRTIDELAVGEAYHAYWFATYPTTIGLGHQYTVTASADNASPVVTSDNYYGNPAPDKTVQTIRALEGGTSRQLETVTDIVVGVAFTVTVEWSLGSNFQELLLSPVGNVDFDPSSYRLIASEVTLFNGAWTPITTVHDRLYFPTVPTSAQYVRGEFIFIALRATATELCPYASPHYSNDFKYDNNFCSPSIPITGTLSLSLTKQASNLTIQQGQPLTYTINYANNGDLPLVYAWIWDDVDINLGSLIASTIDPPSDPGETTDSRVAWYLGDVPESGQAGSTGTLAFTILIDGNGQDLADGDELVNHAFFGINPGSLPQNAALTSTVTTIVQAPTITLSKTDGQDTAGPGDALTYTLRITNSGSITATGLVITDVLPANVDYASGTADPPETSQVGQTLIWDNLGPIPPNGGTVVIAIPVTVASALPDGTILTNTMRVKYENEAGHVFAIKTATDTTTVHLPPKVAFTVASQSEAEDVGTMAVTVELDKVSGLDTTVPFTVGGTATEGAGQDYTITASPVVIPEGSLSVDIIITVNDDNLTEDPETVVVTMGTPVNADKGTPNVHIATILASVCICLSDGYEGDDFAAQAIGLNMGELQPHDFCDDATDWTTFTVQAGGIYTITTSSWGQRADTFLALFDTDGSTLLAADDDYDGAPETDYSSRIVWQAPADGDYYVRTTNRAGLIGCATDYDLLIEEQAQQEPEMVFIYLPIVMRDYGGGSATVEGADIGLAQASGNDVHPMGVINHTCPDDYETDDTLEQAGRIEVDEVQVHSFDSDTGHYAADKDSVWFDVSAGRTITFTVTPINNTPTLLELYDEPWAVLPIVTGTTQLVWTPDSDGRYYLSMSPLTATFGCADAVGYNLSLEEMAEMSPEGAIYLPIIMRDY
jgi:uncharacterized repeat protein (TIGR01451 family)